MKRLRSMKMLSATLLFLLMSTIISPFLSASVMAQATAGGIRGVVSDPGGAVIPDADVTAKNTGTGLETKTKTNSDGLYNLPKLQSGTYVLVIEKQNFKRQEFQQVIVSIGQDQVIDSVLQPGNLTETVTVTAGEELLQKEQAQVSNTFESRKVADLPSNIAGGGIDTLALLAPGVVPGFGNVNSNGTTLSVNGQRSRSNNFTIDGQDNNDLSLGGPAFFVDNADSVGEFQIITNNFSAEYGRNQGAIVNIVTKAGTNEFHGTLSWFHRNRKTFDALTNIEKRGGQEDPEKLIYNVFGGTIGGPIWRDRAWFFGSYQSIVSRQGFIARSANPTIAPEELARLKADFPGNAAIQALADFSSFAITDVGSLTERSDRPTNETVTIGPNTYRVAYPERTIALPDHQKEFSIRGDVKLTDHHSFWYRHLDQRGPGKNQLAGSNGFTGDVPFSGKHSGGNLTSQLTNTAVNEFRFVYSRLSVIFGGGCEGSKGCIPHPDDILQALTNINFTGVRSSGGVNLQTIGAATNLPQGRVVTTYQFADNFSKTFGIHQLKMGVDIRRLTNSVPFLPNVNGAFRFSTAARLAANAPTQVQLAVGEVAIDYNETDQFYYFQDDWRIRENLTLNLGVRYEYTGQPINTINQITVDRESNPETAIWNQSLPLEARIFPKVPVDKNNWAPRLGFAWRPRFGDNRLGKMLFGEQDKTVVRGGYAIAYDPGFYNIMLNVSTSSPVVFLNTTLNPATGTIPFPLPSANPTGEVVQGFATSNGLIVRNTFDPKFFSQTIVAPDFHAPYSQQWSFGIQREITANNVLELRYVGNHAVGLFQTLNRNPRVDRLRNGFTANVAGLGNITFPGFPGLLPPGVTPQVAGQGACVDNPATTTLNESAQCNGRFLAEGLIRSRENTASSTYHGLQSQFRGRLWNQLSFGVSYTFSKALDNASEIFTFSETASPQHPFNSNSAEKGLSGFHRKHASAFNFLWDIPGFKDQSGVVGRVLGGWQINGVYYLASGRRFTPQQFFNTALVSYDDSAFNTSFFGQDAFRPFTGNPSAPRGQVGISQIDAAFIFGVDAQDPNGFYSFNELNTTGNVRVVSRNDVRFIFNGPGAARIFGTPFGDVARGSEHGPKLNNLNLGFFKNIRIKENVRIRFSADGFNILNHKNPGVGFNAGDSFPDPYVEDSGIEDGFYDYTGMTGARRAWQFGVKIIF
jgi:outer membrane receptor protein involved in Fe transport